MEIHDRYFQVLEQIQRTCQRSNRSLDDITLVVITKTHPLEKIEQVIEAGVHNLGENYVEEAREKITAFRDQSSLRWHMVGHVQSRKTAAVAEYFDYVHSLDRVKIARRLHDALVDSGDKLPVLLECNVSGEGSKYGWDAWDRTRWGELAGMIEPIFSYTSIQIKGLMTMAPYSPDAENSRPFFRKLRELAEYLQNQFPHTDFSQLSMGMSGDYQVAIEEGATMLRIGTAIMGERTS